MALAMKPHIEVKSMGIFVYDGKILAQKGYDSVKGENYLRLMGGSVEFGEVSDGALRREMREEIGAEIKNLQLLTVVENTFRFEGKDGHEIVFIYLGALADGDFYSRTEIPFVEPGSKAVAAWAPIARIVSGDDKLYPPMDYKGLFEGLGLA